MTFPNEITSATWNAWVQERGLYFLGDRDPRYRDLVALEDPFPYNKGEKRGALVETTYGKGRWVYVGLGLWRQLPAGTDGAYQMLANLISLAKAPAAKAPSLRTQVPEAMSYAIGHAFRLFLFKIRDPLPDEGLIGPFVARCPVHIPARQLQIVGSTVHGCSGAVDGEQPLQHEVRPRV